MKVIGHRGAPLEALENSFDSFSKAVSIGCQMIELDVWCAKDRSLWVCHDNLLKRTANLNIKISSSSSLELSKVKLLNGEPLPELFACLKKFLPLIPLNIEIKESSKEAAESLLLLLERLPDLSGVVVSCFYLEPLEYLEEKNPNLQLALLSEERNTYKVDPISYLKEHPGWFFHPQADILNSVLMNRLHENNVTVYPWVLRFGVEDRNRESLWEAMSSFKVHGLCTNYPREFKRWLKMKDHR